MLVSICAINTFCISESASLLTFIFFTVLGPIFLQGAPHMYFVCRLSLHFVLLHSLVSDSVLNGGVAKSSTSDQAF